MTRMDAVPMTYAGVDFRSTLEADWAAFLDTLAIAWQYEPEAVRLPTGEIYRPDFYLPECTTWLEVKGPHNDRIEKTYELGAAAEHYPECDGIAHSFTLELSVTTDDKSRTIQKILAEAPDGETKVSLKRIEISDLIPPSHVDDGQAIGRRARTLWTMSGKRRVALDRATVLRLHEIGSGIHITCCNYSNIPWRLVVIGRPAVRGVATFESAQHLDVHIIKCVDCGKYSFFDMLMQWTCRRCNEGGKVYNGGLWYSGHKATGGDCLAFTRAPRNGRRA